MPNEMLLEERLGRIESEVFGTGYAPNVEGLPSALFMPADLQVETTTGPDGTLVTISWANWSPVVQTYEIWATGPDGRENLHATSKVGPVFFTLSVDAVEAWSFKVRPVVQDSTPALEFCPAVAANISPPAVGSADIAAGAVGDSHLDRFSANQIVVVNADIADATITGAKIGTAQIGTAHIIDLAVTNAKVVSLEAIKITAGTFVAGVVYAGAIAATQISAGTITGVNVSAGTYSLTVGSNSMEINGTHGFRQQNTSTNNSVRIFNGTIQVGVNSSGEVTLGTDDGFGGGQTGSGYVFVGNASETERVRLQTNSSGTQGEVHINGVKVIGPQQATVSSPSGGSTVDAEARTAIDALISRLQSHGLIA